MADTGNDRVQRFTLDGGHGAEIVPPGTLANPRGLAVRRTRLFVADDQHHRLVVFDTGGHLLRAIGQAGSGPGQLNFPYGVATDAAGRVFVADDLNHRVVRFSSGPLYPYKGRWGSYGTAPGRLAYPRGIAVDPARATSTWPTPATTASTSSTRAARSCARSARRAGRRGSSTRRWASRRTPAASAR